MEKKTRTRQRRPVSLKDVCDALGLRDENVRASLIYGDKKRIYSAEKKRQIADEYRRQAELFAQFLETGK
jgi:hypothetical protein